MASRRTTVVVRRVPPPASPASRQLLIRARQRQACQSALLLMGLLGIILATILSMTVTTKMKREYDAIPPNNAPVGRIRRLQGSSVDQNNSNQLLIQEKGVRGTSKNNQTFLLPDSPISISDVTYMPNATTTTSEEMPRLSQA